MSAYLGSCWGQWLPIRVAQAYNGADRFYRKEGPTGAYTSGVEIFRAASFDGWHRNYKCLILHKVFGTEEAIRVCYNSYISCVSFVSFLSLLSSFLSFLSFLSLP